MVYGDEPTQLVVAAEEAGAAVVDGIEILARQGVHSFRIWTGRDAPLEPMLSAARGEASL
jgi:shikimate 5-dehydrogenase